MIFGSCRVTCHACHAAAEGRQTTLPIACTHSALRICSPVLKIWSQGSWLIHAHLLTASSLNRFSTATQTKSAPLAEDQTFQVGADAAHPGQTLPAFSTSHWLSTTQPASGHTSIFLAPGDVARGA